MTKNVRGHVRPHCSPSASPWKRETPKGESEGMNCNKIGERERKEQQQKLSLRVFREPASGQVPLLQGWPLHAEPADLRMAGRRL